MKVWINKCKKIKKTKNWDGVEEGIEHSTQLIIEENTNVNQHEAVKDYKHEIPSCVCLGGTTVEKGKGLLLVTCVGPNSTEGKIKELAEQDADMTPLQKKLNKIATDISKLGFVAGVVTVIVLYIRLVMDISSDGWDNQHLQDIVDYFIIGITVLVVAIPEGLPLAVTISLAYSVMKMLRD